VFQIAYLISLEVHRASLKFPKTQVWLRYCCDLEYVDQKMSAAWRDEYRQIAKMLQALYTAWGASSDH
jgi:hypothetical protein